MTGRWGAWLAVFLAFGFIAWGSGVYRVLGLRRVRGLYFFSEGIALEVRSKGSFRFRDSCSEGPLERGPT